MRFAFLTTIAFLLATNSSLWAQSSPLVVEALRKGRLPGETTKELKQRIRMLKSIEQIRKMGGFADATTVKLGPTYRGGNTALPLLMQFPKLETVEIINPGSSISDVGLASMQNLKTVRQFRIEGIRLNQGSLAYLSNWRKVSRIALVGTGVTDSGLRSLQSMSTLNAVRLSEPKVLGPALGYLRRSKRLTTLQLDSSGVTDASLKHIKPFRYLRYLSVEDTSVTDEALRELWEINPELRIVASEGGKPAGRGEPFGQPITVAGAPKRPILPPKPPRRP